MNNNVLFIGPFIKTFLLRAADNLKCRVVSLWHSLCYSSKSRFVPEPWDTEDHMHHAGGASSGAGDPEWRAAGEGETVGRLEGDTGGGEEPGWEADQGGPEAAGHRETEQVLSTALNLYFFIFYLIYKSI